MGPQDRANADWPTGRLLSTAARHVEHEWNAYLDRWNLTHASHPVLHLLALGPRSQRELARLTEVTEQTMSRALDRLERAGYVERAPHERDRRQHVVSLTDAGRGALDAAGDPAEAERIATRGLDGAQAATLRALLAAMIRARDDGAPQ